MAILFISNFTFGLSVARYFWFCNYSPPWMFSPWIFILNIGLNMLPSDSFMSCLDSLIRYSTGELKALQLIVLVVFGAVD